MSLADKIFTRIERRKDGGEIIFPSFIQSEDVAEHIEDFRKETCMCEVHKNSKCSICKGLDKHFGDLK